MKRCYVSCICAMLFAIGILNASNSENQLILDCTFLTAPEDGALDVFPDENLFWTVVPDATGYIVRMGTQPGAGDFIDNEVTTGPFLNIPPMENNTIYYVSITPFTLNEVAEDCFETSFQVGDLVSPDCISIDAPQNGATDVSIFTSFEWTEIENSFGYVLSLGTTPYGREVIDNLDIGDVTSFSVNELDYSTTYYINVIPYGELGEAVGCDEETFTTESLPTPPCPIINEPNNNATDVAINSLVSWNPAENADGYTISIGTIPGSGDIVNEENVIASTSLDPGTLEYNTIYYVAINAYNDFGVSQNCGNFSFTTEQLPNMLSISCPEALVVQAPIGIFSAEVNWEEPIVSTSCEDGEYILTQTAGFPNGSNWPIGEATTVKYEVIDNCGNTNSCNFNVTVLENLLEFSSTCPNNVTLTTDNPNGRVITLNEPFFTTNCGDENITISQIEGPESGTLFPIGTSTIAYEVNLNCNGEIYTESCFYEINIELVPSEISIICPSNQILQAPIGATTMMVSWEPPAISTSCGDEEFTVIQVSGLPNGSNWPVGQTVEVQYEVTDVCGNSNSCNFNVVIEENPLVFDLTCMDDITLTTLDPNGHIVDIDMSFVTTNCDEENVIISQATGPESGTLFPIGNSLVTYEVSLNCNGQTYTQTCNINVNVELEFVECTEEINGFKLLGQFNNHNYFIAENPTTWATASTIANTNGGTLLSVNSADENEFVRTLLENNIVFIGLFENESGNYVWDSGEPFTYNFIETPATEEANFANMNFWSGGWSFDSEYVERLFVMEITCGDPAPSLSINCSESQNITSENIDSIIVTWNAPIANSTCTEGEVLIEQVEGPISGSWFEVGTTTTITYKIEDACNNVEICSFTIAVSGPPSTSCPENVDGLTLLGEYEGHKYFLSNESATWLEAAEFALENGGYLVSINDEQENEFIRQNISEITLIGLNDFENEGTLAWDSGEPYVYNFLETANQVGLNFASINFWNGGWTLENNQVSKPFIVEFDCENSEPVLTTTCSENLILEAIEGANSVFLVYEIPTGTSTCSESAISVVQTVGPEYGASLDVGARVNIEYEISDACGNVETCAFDVRVVPFEPNECPETLENFSLIGDFEQHSYFLSNLSTSWEEAQAIAADLGGYLVSISSPAENEFIRSNISEITFIGLHDQNVEGTFEWDSGETYFSGNLLDGNSEAEDFGTINFWNGGWGTVDQFVQKRFIVELDCQIIPQENPRIGNTIPVSIGKVYPNPSKEFVTVEVESEIESTSKIRIFDVLGVFQKEIAVDLIQGKTVISIEINDLKNGIHFLQINEEHSAISKKKFVKF